MSSRRLKDRLSSASVICVARLFGHRLMFHKKSKDGSAKCDALYSGESEDLVIGVVYEIHDREKTTLDRIEERGYGYEEKTVELYTSQGETLVAMTYYARTIDSTLRPYHWYREHVVIGAREHCLPIDYIRAIEQVESIADPRPDRHTRELQIYR